MLACLTVAVVGLFSHAALAQGTYKNYEITIDGRTHEVNLEEPLEIQDANGRKVKVMIRKKLYSEYADDFVAFQHKSDLAVSSKRLDEGITQLMLATATGTIVMVQEYEGIRTDFLVPLMLEELTKESVEYGFKRTQKKTQRKLKSGIALEGVQATLTYQNQEVYWEVLAFSHKDKGILVVTSIHKDFQEADQGVHTRFWDTLTVKK
jgi:hypothetical protein